MEEQDKELESLRVRVGNTTEPNKVTFLPRRNSRTDIVGSNDSNKPLIETDARRNKPEPPIAGPEIDEFDDNDDDDREVAREPYPGVDDGFFSNGGEPPRNPDAEEFPGIEPRAGKCIRKEIIENLVFRTSICKIKITFRAFRRYAK